VTVSVSGFNGARTGASNLFPTAATPDCPEEVGVGFLARFDFLAVHEHDARRDQVVAPGAEQRQQQSFAAAEREATETHVVMTRPVIFAVSALIAAGSS
jgi:hypothetical protein